MHKTSPDQCLMRGRQYCSAVRGNRPVLENIPYSLLIACVQFSISDFTHWSGSTLQCEILDKQDRQLLTLGNILLPLLSMSNTDDFCGITGGVKH